MDNRRKFPGIEVDHTSDELNLMPDSNRDAIFSIAKSLGNEVDFIISGVDAVINPSIDASVSDGYVLIDGEVLKVDAQIVPRTEGTDIYVFQKQTTDGDAPDWVRNFRDGSTNNVFEKNRAIVVNVVTAGTDLPINGYEIQDVLTPILNPATPTDQGVMTAIDKSKLDGIQNGAEVNVNANWDSTGGDSQILNKPEVLERIGSTLEISYVNNSTTTLLAPGNDVTPLFCSIVGICKVANNGYSIGTKIQVNKDALITNLTLASVVFRIPTSGLSSIASSTNTVTSLSPSQWNIQVTVWGYKF